jgi:hypothetical protein
MIQSEYKRVREYRQAEITIGRRLEKWYKYVKVSN